MSDLLSNSQTVDEKIRFQLQPDARTTARYAQHPAPGPSQGPALRRLCRPVQK
ncbi:hypothetical protein C4K23_3522 [Pseudomonas chlororaphis]|nr:hypothetical protein C4K23_3522 [Pseudomonas chlororaphis]